MAIGELERQLLEDHVARFNEGVRSGEFTPMLEGFAEDAELRFEGVPVGPFHGKDAIAEAYRTQPPDDELEVLSIDERNGELVAGYAWRRRPVRRAGEMRVAHDGRRITRLVVTFDW